jgi:hypothetical protein
MACHSPALAVVMLPAGLALAFYPAMRWTGAARGIAFWASFIVMMAAPLTIDPAEPHWRFAAALAVGWMSSKLLDLHFGVRPQERPGFIEYAVYVFNPFWVVRRLRPPDTVWLPDARLLVVRVALFVIAYAACAAVFTRVQWSRYPFAIEHAAKALVVMPLMIFTVNLASVAWRVCGGRGLDFMRPFPLLAATPAEFWRRWNRPAQQLFRAYVSDVVGGARRPARAILATFAVSALGHEYIFSVAAARLQGYQSAFFMLHGLAVVATLRLRPKGAMRILWIVATLAFLVVTTVLFGLSANEIIPLYDARG